ncbi:hypothetical protein [Streptomyces sp. NPDC002209]|uniref:hypothetical protein n=1 Tax=Streptomyces sp. NPDC002209 TaxID=3364638 RepID=UPI0036CC334B
MDPMLAMALAVTAATLIVAVAAVLLARCALADTDSAHKARVLVALAEVIRAIRGRR